uniref:Uncharacterized protein n=1 Tax=Oryza nivara TaxID=4536 RepID=A0A0E0G484_ORYNI
MVLSRAWYLRHDIVQCRGGERSGGEGGGGGGVAVELEAPGTAVVCVGWRREQQRSAETGGGGGTETVEERSGATRRRTRGSCEEWRRIVGHRGGDRGRLSVIKAEIVGGADGMEEGEGSGERWEGISEAGVGVLGTWFDGGVTSLAVAAAERVEENGGGGESGVERKGRERWRMR